MLRRILLALLPAFMVLALALLGLTYYSSSRIMDENIQGQFQQAKSRLQINLDTYLNRLYTLLSATAEHAGLASLMANGEQGEAEAVLHSILEKPDGEHLDILMLLRQGNAWLNLNSPYYDLAPHEAVLVEAANQDQQWVLVQLEPSPTVLLHRYPIIANDSGRIEGSLLGGVVLDDNLTLLNLLGQGLEQMNIRLLHQGNLLGPPASGNTLARDILNSILADAASQGQVRDHHFSAQPLQLGEETTLQALLVTDNQATRQLRQAYWHHGLLALVLVLAAALLPAFYTMRLIAAPLARLTDFAEHIGQGLPAHFQPGQIAEFNFLGQSLEEMVEILHRRERELANLFNSANSLTIILDGHNRIQAINPAAVLLFEGHSDAVIGTPLSDHFSPQQLAPLHQAISQVTRGHIISGVEASLTHGSKDRQHQIWTLAPVYEQDSVVAVLAQGQDITPLKQARASLELNDLVLKNIMEAVLVFDHRLRLVYANHAFTNISGYQPEEMLHKKPGVVLQLQSSDRLLMTMWQTLNSAGYWRGEASALRKEGIPYPIWLSVTALNTAEPGKRHYVAVFSDISMLKETQNQLQRMAHYDPLTGLANRTLFTELFRQAHSRAERHCASMAMLFIDLDRFKQINDSLGHQVGDEFLQIAAKRLRRHSRKEDILCRFGGDEFILLVTNTLSLQQARAAAQRIVDAFAKPVLIRGQSLYTSISIGVAFYPQHGTSMEALMQHADTALYQAKEKGRNQVQLFESGMNIRAVNMMKISGELHQALEKNQMVLHYQPQFRLSDGKMVGVEALVRWNKPGTGLIYPIDFIPLAEQTGMILPLGQWILTTACRQLQRWHTAGLGSMRMAINLSARQFRQPGLVQDIAVLLRELKLDPATIELEITESMLMEEMEMAVATMTSLNRLGVKLAIDDFGTGYSSLAYLKRFPIHRLKIDKSFIQDLARQEEDTAIVGSIITLAHNMKIAVIAEGIEDEYQLQQLSRQSCDEGQGYLLAKPMPVSEIEPLLLQDFRYPALRS
ncbi:EAL domain-containing protein [Zobellella sp. DQSA1]|uniref:EAL domain-containing protein n=1 Tax=Zobellella sp. DQSA1 TaxID=3342386 RepID=UPI0035BF9DE5